MARFVGWIKGKRAVFCLESGEIGNPGGENAIRKEKGIWNREAWETEGGQMSCASPERTSACFMAIGPTI